MAARGVLYWCLSRRPSASAIIKLRREKIGLIVTPKEAAMRALRCRHSLVSDLAGSVAVTRMLDLLDLRVHARLLGSVSTCSFQ
jgi:hypothetical protein